MIALLRVCKFLSSQKRSALGLIFHEVLRADLHLPKSLSSRQEMDPGWRWARQSGFRGC